MRFAASLFMTAFLIGLCAVLAGPAFDLQTFGRTGQIAAGALPQAVVVATIVLAALSMGEDVLALARRGPKGAAPPELEGGIDAPAGRVLGLGLGILALLTGYVVLWRYIGFPAASTVFMAAAATVLAPKEARGPRGLAIIAVTSVLFCVGVWLAFVHLLAVPLR